MPCIYETAPDSVLNTSFFFITPDYSLVHLKSCWSLAAAWLSSIECLTLDAVRSTYVDDSSVTALGNSQEESLYRTYVLDMDVDEEAEVVLQFRVVYRSSRSASYKNNVVIEMRMGFGTAFTAWSKVSYIDNNNNEYTNNRRMASPYVLYQSADKRGFCFAQGIIYSSANSISNDLPIPSHGLFAEYDPITKNIFGSVTYSESLTVVYFTSASNCALESGKNNKQDHFKLTKISYSSKMGGMPFDSNIGAVAVHNVYGYTYKSFVYVFEVGSLDTGCIVNIDGVDRNFAPLNIGYSAGTSPLRYRIKPILSLPIGNWYYPVGAVMLFGVIS